ncbi:hypothetical protein FNH09_03895 [Streptomyces adustus]|uniref:Uncharacterized protein n=1 Tax=Streptomyces adustus TaxID=1609272 RepID=A0A5N8V5D4_9ACTN|nr:SAV_915 family protein [Streptomyces adustus]MPY30481.1 hypothetical protein [Streptomyces adustus]
MESTSPVREAPNALVLPTVTDMSRGDDGAPVLEGTVDVLLVPLEAESGEDRLVALAFSTVALLVDAMGEEQPWVAIPTEKLEDALRGSGAQAVLLNPGLAEGAGVVANG